MIDPPGAEVQPQLDLAHVAVEFVLNLDLRAGRTFEIGVFEPVQFGVDHIPLRFARKPGFVACCRFRGQGVKLVFRI